MRLPFLMLFLFISATAVAQQKAKHGKAKRVDIERDLFSKHAKCHYHKKYSAQQRTTFYPFSVASEVQLIGFRGIFDRVILENGEEDTTVLKAVSKPMYTPNNSNSYDLNKGRLISSVKLSPQGVDSLTDILYNYGYTPVKLPKNVTWIDEPTGCYDPRNAILFLDAKGKVIEYMEICFACEQTRWSSRKIKDVTFCVDKYAMIRRFFFKNDITYGTKP